MLAALNYLPNFSKNRSINWTFVGAFLTFNWYWISTGQLRTAVAAALLAQIIALTVLNREIGICITFAYLIMMGDIRRIVSVELGFPQLDLLLLIGPITAAWLSAPIFAGIRLADPLAKCITALMFVMVLQIFNPKQGRIAVGIAGAMFYLVPLLWFWIGKSFGQPRVLERLLYKVVLPLGFIAAFLGLAQTFVGFLPWEQAWIDTGALSVKVGDAFRAFGFSVSPAEYTRLLIFTAALTASLFFRRRLWCVAMPIILLALFLESSRGPVIRIVIAFAVMWGLRHKLQAGSVRRTLVALALLLAVIYAASSRLSSDSPPPNGPSGTQSLIAHQAGGLSHPFDAKQSTLGSHLTYFGIGLTAGLKSPLGFGLGATTSAASKVGSGGEDASNFSTELDFTDMFAALGLVGGLLYLTAAFLALRSAYAFLQLAPRHLGLAVVGILVANFGNWSISGEYSSSALLWFLIGATTIGNAHEKANSGAKGWSSAHPENVLFSPLV